MNGVGQILDLLVGELDGAAGSVELALGGGSSSHDEYGSVSHSSMGGQGHSKRCRSWMVQKISLQ
jgi:hypothetical protein